MVLPIVPQCNQTLQAPDDGYVSQITGKAGDIAVYSCKDNYVPVGIVSSTCQEDGQWSTTQPPQCKGLYMLCISCQSFPPHLKLPCVIHWRDQRTAGYYILQTVKLNLSVVMAMKSKEAENLFARMGNGEQSPPVRVFACAQCEILFACVEMHMC